MSSVLLKIKTILFTVVIIIIDSDRTSESFILIFFCFNFFFYWSRARELWLLAIVGVTVEKVVWLLRLVGNTLHVHAWHGFCHHGPWWSPIRELVAAAFAYSQPRCVIDFIYWSAPSHFYTNNIIYSRMYLRTICMYNVDCNRRGNTRRTGKLPFPSCIISQMYSLYLLQLWSTEHDEYV